MRPVATVTNLVFMNGVLGTLSGESRCVCVQLRVPCRVLIEEVSAACVLVGVYICMVTAELESHAGKVLSEQASRGHSIGI